MTKAPAKTGSKTPTLADRGALFDVLASTAVDGIIVIDKSAKILFFNQACVKLFQYAPDDVLGKNVRVLMPEPYRKEHDEYVARYQKTHEAHIIGIGREVRGQRKDGSVFPMYLSVGEGHFDGATVYVGIVHDLTAMRAEEERREASDRHLAEIVASSDDIILSKTLGGIVTSWNAAAERIFGYSAEEILGQPITLIIPQELHAEEDEILRRVAAGESITHYETVRRGKSGEDIQVSLSVSPLRDSNGRIVGVSKIARDVTAKKAAEAQSDMLQAELAHISRVNAIGQLSSALAHELNQPLTAIMNYVGAAKRRLKANGGGETEKASALLDRALEQTERAGKIIHRLRGFLERREPNRAEEDINEIVQEAVALGFVGAAQENVALKLDLEPDLPLVLIDRIQIEQVLVNLIRNAGEAMRGEETKSLSVSTYLAGKKNMEIAVADTGPGIPEDVAAQLFQPFVTTKETGMGVGLSICRTIVEAHGGRIWMTPNPEGGTIFKFQLPVGE